MMRFQRSPYSGVLAEPMEGITPPGLRPDRPPPLFFSLGYQLDVWRPMLDRSRANDARRLLVRLMALYDHFGIDRSRPGADLEMALTLARRHEQDIFADNDRVNFSSLCEKYETADPLQLALKLAFKHVPGFQVRARQFKSRLTTPELIEIFFAWMVVHQHLLSKQGKVSAHAVADVMLDEKCLPEVIPAKAAIRVQSILQRSGNADRGTPRKLKSRKSALRGIVREALRSWRDYKAGRPSELQMQMLTEVYPCLYSLAGPVGQISASPEA